MDAAVQGETTVISFETDAGRFTFRVAGVCAHAGHVLLHRAATDDFWALPGGRPELGEDSRTALVREMREELGVEIDCGHLLWVLESFSTFDGRANHRLALYFMMEFPPASPLLDLQREHAGIEPENPLLFRWFPVEHLGQVRIFPSILRTELGDLPAAPRHLILTDEPE